MNISTPNLPTTTLGDNLLSSKSEAGFSLDGGKTTNSVPLQAQPDKSVDLSSSGKFFSVDDREGLLKFGQMALGSSTLADWSNKGLEVSEETLIAAAKAFQDSFKQIVDKYGSNTAGSSAVINKHQIAINEQQQVPDWFIQEYDTALAIIDDPTHQQAFSQGALFFTKPPTASPESFAYQSIASYR